MSVHAQFYRNVFDVLDQPVDTATDGPVGTAFKVGTHNVSHAHSYLRDSSVANRLLTDH